MEDVAVNWDFIRAAKIAVQGSVQVRPFVNQRIGDLALVRLEDFLRVFHKEHALRQIELRTVRKDQPFTQPDFLTEPHFVDGVVILTVEVHDVYACLPTLTVLQVHAKIAVLNERAAALVARVVVQHVGNGAVWL